MFKTENANITMEQYIGKKKGVEIGQVNVACKDEVKKRGIFDGIYAIAAS